MDNITKKSSIKTLSKISNIVLFIFPLLADLLGIAALFISNLQVWINDKIGTVSGVVIIAILNVVFLFNIVFIMEKKETKKSNKSKKFLEGYGQLLKNYTDYLTGFENKCADISTVEDLYEETSKCLKTLIDEIGSILSDATGSKIRVCIKAFPEKYTHRDVTQMKLMTFCRSDKTLMESARERKDRIEVQKNTDFKLIMLNTYPYFAFNNLKNFENETKTEYENSSSKWEKKYNATIVYPISKCIGTEGGKDLFQVLGFICVDTLSTKAFSAEVGPMCIKFIASLSCILYIFLDKCISYREKIEINNTNTERECVSK